MKHSLSYIVNPSIEYAIWNNVRDYVRDYVINTVGDPGYNTIRNFVGTPILRSMTNVSIQLQ